VFERLTHVYLGIEAWVACGDFQHNFSHPSIHAFGLHFLTLVLLAFSFLKAILFHRGQAV
jgi:hypothetical protein